jgi:hypothetical protein
MINENEFNKIIKTSLLKQNSENDELAITRINIYNIPKHWVKLLKDNRFSFSNYCKQALFEKLQRDKLL